MKLLPENGISPARLILLSAIFMMAFHNFAFFQHVLEVYPLNRENIGFLISLVIGFTGFIIVVLTLLAVRWLMKPLIIFLMIASSAACYFMDAYHVVIDKSMLDNALATDTREVRDLLSLPMVLYITGFGLLPALWIARVKIVPQSWLRDLFSRLKLLVLTLIVMAGCALAFSDYYGTFFREHKPVRYYFNPGSYLYAVYKLGKEHLGSDARGPVTPIGEDAKLTDRENGARRLIIFVVGETARGDHFSLNGYARETNPLLAKRDIINFPDVTSCGTSTAVSVPCMFSAYTADEYNESKVKHTENALDVMHRTGAHVLWRDNNSSSKGVADRVEYQDYRSAKLNPVCDEVECRDTGMLEGLQEYIDSKADGDIVIVLHQMGNHGPAYYKRYPKEFEKFKPTCQTNELKDCSLDELTNAYDNAILYTDYFLSQTIDLLEKNDGKFETAMLYLSDHGESLGENGLYLHGMPNFIAPDSQRKVPMVLWLGKQFDHVDRQRIEAERKQPYSQDNIFHTLLGFLGIESSIYQKDMDLIHR